MFEDNKIYNMDCLVGLPKIKESSVDMILTSPPYDNLREYDKCESFIWNETVWKKVLSELFRVLKKGGVLVWVVGDATVSGSETGTAFSQALYAKKIGFNLHDTMIYQKSTPIPQFKAHRYTGAFEYMFVFSKGKPQRGNLLELPTKQAGRVDKNYRGQVRADGVYVGREKKVVKDSKLRTNIWVYSQNNGIDRKIDHKAQFPEKLAEDHILSWSNTGDLILDPFMGSGTTAKMCLLNKRRFLGFEICKHYCELADKRIAPYMNKKN